mmetsp:Transcript_3481/g.7782  ORF Transcript_3481/g.7782 Transcript_3481/m.7782 type:complete len:160 (+) Transcript_3481:634-1113(+)
MAGRGFSSRRPSRMCAEHPQLLEPISRLQTQLRRRLLGEKWWTNQEFQLERRALLLKRANESKRKQEEKRLLKERSEAIRAEVGLIQFLFCGRAWREAETSHPRPIVTVDKSGEIKVDCWIIRTDIDIHAITLACHPPMAVSTRETIPQGPFVSPRPRP